MRSTKLDEQRNAPESRSRVYFQWSITPRDRVISNVIWLKSMTAPTHQLPSVQRIATLPKRSQVAYAIRCAKRVEPLYADKIIDPVRARHVRACIELATSYFLTEKLVDATASIIYNYKPRAKDHGVQAAEFAAMAAVAAFNEDNDPDYDAEEAEYDEMTSAHRVDHAATFSLLAVYESHAPIEEARRCERLVLAVTLVDFRRITENQDFQELADVGPLWQHENLETFADRLAKHGAILLD